MARHAPVGPVGAFLERFRRSAGVPAAVGGDLSVELAPVFAELDKIDRDVAQLRERSEEAAARRLREAADEAQRIVDEGRERSASERNEALRTGLQAAEAEVAEVTRRAEARAEAIRRDGEQRLPQLVAQVLARTLEAGR